MRTSFTQPSCVLSPGKYDGSLFDFQAVGEPPLFLSASVFFAIKNAVGSARRDSNVAGHFRLDAPATAEKIRMSCVDHITKKVTWSNVTVRLPEINFE